MLWSRKKTIRAEPSGACVFQSRKKHHMNRKNKARYHTHTMRHVLWPWSSCPLASQGNREWDSKFDEWDRKRKRGKKSENNRHRCHAQQISLHVFEMNLIKIESSMCLPISNSASPAPFLNRFCDFSISLFVFSRPLFAHALLILFDCIFSISASLDHTFRKNYTLCMIHTCNRFVS